MKAETSPPQPHEPSPDMSGPEEPQAVTHRPYLHKKFRLGRKHHLIWVVIVAVCVAAGAYWIGHHGSKNQAIVPKVTPAPTPRPPQAGELLGIESVQPIRLSDAAALVRANYGAASPPVHTAITKITFRYRSKLPGGPFITVFGRAYLPESPQVNLPVFAFAPGTTGIGDKCAPSLENPKVSNWANYDSHMATYASQGFAAVTTDYEGMRDPTRLHHYMVGELEGRAVLDSIRALKQLPQAKGRLAASDIFAAGYSQGGHAAFWADKIAGQYAPDVMPKGVIGFGPVMNVKQTLTDVTHGANINWFGPYVLYSYHDYYGADYGVPLLPHWQQTLAKDVPAHCIDTDIPFWGSNPANVYTPEFIQAMTSGQLGGPYANFERDLDANAVGPTATSSAKLINQGAHDNVVLPAQQEALAPALCQSSKGPFQLKLYPNATHYTTMAQSLNDTLGWMRSIIEGRDVPGCQG